MIRILQLALRDLWERPLRFVLTVFGISIAVATFVAVQGVVVAFERAVMNNIAATETHLEITEAGALDFLSSLVPENLAARLVGVDGIESASPMLVRLVPVASTSVPLLGWPDTSYLWATIKILEGRKPQAGGAVEAVAGKVVAQRQALSVGSRLKLSGTDVEIVGIADTESRINQSAIFLRLPDLQTMAYRPGQATSITIRLRPDALPAVETIKKAVAEKVLGYGLIDTATLTRDNFLLGLVRALTAALSIIAVVLGFFGVLSTVWTVARERRHELAILRAVGWPLRRVALFMFFQAAAVAFAGLCLGAALGHAGVIAVSHLSLVSGYLEPRFDPVLFCGAALACLLISIIGTLLPVWGVATEDPSSILRSP
jgi:putative ABC transport system permease protein